MCAGQGGEGYIRSRLSKSWQINPSAGTKNIFLSKLFLRQICAAALLLLELKKNQLAIVEQLKSGRCRKHKRKWNFLVADEASGVPEFSALGKFWQKTLKRWSNVTKKTWSNVTCVQEWNTLTCLERKYQKRNRWTFLYLLRDVCLHKKRLKVPSSHFD